MDQIVKVCLINIATNRYIKFLDPLWDSVNKNFLPEHDVQSLLFTNHNIEPITKNGKVSYIDHQPFPTPTLMRYHYMLSEEEYLSQFDYCFYIDVDMLITSKVGDEILGELVATIHPYFYDKTNESFTYETNQNSTAYVENYKGDHYFAGGFNGGNPENFLNMAKIIVKNVDTDLNNNIVAVWHDESHLNKYLVENKPTVKLNPSYCYPEWWTEDMNPFKRKIVALDKDHAEFRV